MRLAVFASGGGSNFQAILDAIADGRLAAEAVLCLSNRPAAGALVRAADTQVPHAVLQASADDPQQAQAEEILALLRAHHADFIALAGYMRLIPAAVVQAFRHRMLNVHPALLPAFGGPGMYGKRVHQAVLNHGVRWTGATVHLVDEAYDTGPIVLQAPVPVAQDDTPETLAQRVLGCEHQLFPAALQLFAEGRVTVEGRRVRIDGPFPTFAPPVLP